MKNCLLILFCLIFTNERMVMIVAVFLFGYCVGYYLFEILQYKNSKDDIERFLSNYKKNMAQGIELLTKKIQDIKITDDIFFEKDFSFEQKFLNQIVEVYHEKIKDCEVLFHLSKTSMHICCEMLTLTTTSACMLLEIVDSSMKVHFRDGLSRLGWCAHYMIYRRNLDYYTPEKNFCTSRLTDFYWFNNSSDRFTNQKTLN